MTWEVAAVCLLIFFARIADVSLGTLRTIFVINGRRGVAFVLAFFEVLVWVVVVSQVITHLNNVAYAVAYALGFATGNFVGMTVEKWVAIGQQVVRVFTRRGVELAGALREAGYGVTQIAGEGRDGPVYILFIQTHRREVPDVAARARRLDPACYYLVDDIREASSISPPSNVQRTLGGLVQRK